MKVIYTKHAEEKLTRADIRKFKITKKLLEDIVTKSERKNKSKYGEFAENRDISDRHIVRVIYDIIDQDIKIITFHIARKGRYENET